MAGPLCTLASAALIVSVSARTAPSFQRDASEPQYGDMTVFFENDGNWTSHGSKPSGVFINTPSSYSAATAACAAQNETLLSCEKYVDFTNLFSYQQWLGTITPSQLFWSSCSSSSPTSWSGVVQSNANSSSELLPFLCTNSAPMVDKVDTDYSNFPRVNATSNGTTFEGMRDHMAFRFAGIPFVQPPTGDLRFQPARPWNQSFSYVDATKYGPACLQFGYFDGDAYGLNPWGNSEDCLYLNIYTPYIPSSDSLDPDNGKPVMVWIYGGGDTQGSGADSTFDGASLASRSDVVVVTFNYRLNIFGLLALDDDEIKGNYMMTDKIEALRWVRQYIAGFGGNPKNVTIFGQSAGASSVNDLITCPAIIGEELFQNGIVQSGKSNVATAEVAAAYALPYIERFCNGTTAQRASCLRSLPAETLLNITNNSISWYTVMDGHYSADYTQARYGLGAQYINSVNVMAGNMLEEYQSLATTSLWPSMTNFSEALEILVSDSALNKAQAAAVARSGLYTVTNTTVYNGSTTYTSVYNASVHIGTEGQLYCDGTLLQWIAAASWAFKSHWFYIHNRGYALSYYDFYDLCTFPVGQPDTPYYRCHSSDLYEVFGTYYIFDQPVRVPEDIYYTNAVQDMWGAFARTGNPNVDPAYLIARSYDSTLEFFVGFEWPQFTITRPSVASLQFPGPKVSSLPYQDHCEVLLPYVTNPAAPGAM
ncbi:carboxylesterase [Aspergillus ibericus CBS 121593]|uniref:Carboxylesterase n=1 Tax=Aspergillus ibericus CBS 121593 TaxID=1448316 RepID=A0A395GRF7_9EURO|nr:carboxylesterase [Aspergillus ibericus CBS 121593]RAK98150.1 carboxylesterase [Aspergillus ibericus CBS 121593]